MVDRPLESGASLRLSLTPETVLAPPEPPEASLASPLELPIPGGQQKQSHIASLQHHRKNAPTKKLLREVPKPSQEVAEERRSFLWTVIKILFFLDWRLLPFVSRQSSRRQGRASSVSSVSRSSTPDRRRSRSPESPGRDRRKSPRPSMSSPTSSLPAVIRRLIYTETPLKPPDRKTLVLDLDETLIHSMTRGGSGFGVSHMVEVQLADQQLSSIYYVDKRPHCQYFLDTVSQWYNLVVFTASVQAYADPMIDWLERELGRKVFSRRLYRSDCISDGDGYVKDLTVIGADLGRVIIVDNSPLSFSLQRYNGIGIEGWISDPSDRALLNLLPLLNALQKTLDVRSLLCLQDGEKCWASTSLPTSAITEAETETDY